MSSTTETRHIIRPEHFALAPQLLGMELARPARRLGAILLDLALVSILVKTAGPWLFALAAAYAFFRFASRRTGGTTRRILVRVAGALILFLAVKRGFNAAQEYARGKSDAPRVAAASVAGGGRKASAEPAKAAEPGLGTAMRVTTSLVALHNAKSAEEARPIAQKVVASFRESGMDDDAIRKALADFEEDSGKPWMEEALKGLVAPLSAAPAPLPPETLAVRYAAALTSGDSAAADSLRPRVGVALASDTLTALDKELKEERTEKAAMEQRAEAAEEARDEKKGLLGSLIDLLEDLGLGFGWTGLYFTAFTALWRGQTPGKRLLGVRVLRLDGKPLTMWGSFERFGGYAAGLVTGLLGFAQVFWDRNRQAIHDKISETVVVRERKSAPEAVAPPASQLRPHPLPVRPGPAPAPVGPAPAPPG
ncbi:MAG TPA: RDD family protein, partial [Longimicrobium sp.]|nr:RDD family protein [Longimicrobium sp.]